MANTYTAEGKLAVPVKNVGLAREYLQSNDMTEFVKYASYTGLEIVAHDIRWDLTDAETWKVTVVTERLLTAEESAGLSEWISGQNSDGLGEGFEQQPFAEHEFTNEDDGEEDYEMSSFDWQTNDCKLTLVK